MLYLGMLSKAREKLAEQLFDIGAIKFGAFRLKLHEKKPDAPLSPIYIDLRLLRSFPSAMDLAIEVYMELITGLKFDFLADVPTAATPIAAILSHRMKVPMVSPRKDEKGHGITGKINGVFETGQTALLIDDLEAAGYKSYCAFKLSDLLQFYRQAGKIDRSQYERTIVYLGSSPK